ncbi:AfsR/SARP family transcriptional regulator [Dactylosporangium sp. NPDC050688]|uniref:AfsR/SARP family transcriptional regulator n=1 Tax=Dactylosporangium sp. NPDC050688 TaxID=3157217 RepID=UPI0033EF3BAB
MHAAPQHLAGPPAPDTGPALFRLLGPLTVTIGAQTLPIGGVRSRAVLATLLLDAGKVVSTDQLVEATWGADPPASARIQVQNRIGRLRRTLQPVPSADALIGTAPGGYTIRPRDGDLDLDRFRALTGTAERLEAAGAAARAAHLLGQALQLRRGPALDGLTTPYLASAAHGIEQRWLLAFEHRVRLELRLGRPAHLVEPLRAMTVAHPYREELHGLLMAALYRAGRQADALAAYRTARRILTEQLGLEPCPMLQSLNLAILRRDGDTVDAEVSGQLARPRRPSAVQVSTPPVRRELPAVPAGLTERAEQLSLLDQAAGTVQRGPVPPRGLPPRDGPPAAPAVLVHGPPGAGKTALAVHWAHRAAGQFPDGQLYLELNGPSGPVEPADALARLLRSLGVPGPSGDVPEAAALLRSVLAGRRVLLLLDDASSIAQVEPLLPGGPEAFVMIIARARLGALTARHDMARVQVGPLSAAAARRLLTALVGATRVHAEPDAATDLVHLCARLPLALRIAAGGLLDRPHRRLSTLVQELRTAHGLRAWQRMDPAWAALTGTLDASHGLLPAPARQLLHRMGTATTGPVSPATAAAFTDGDPTAAARWLDLLCATHLVHEHPDGRYTVDPLTRRYVHDRVASPVTTGLWREHGD